MPNVDELSRERVTKSGHRARSGCITTKETCLDDWGPRLCRMERLTRSNRLQNKPMSAPSVESSRVDMPKRKYRSVDVYRRVVKYRLSYTLPSLHRRHRAPGSGVRGRVPHRVACIAIGLRGTRSGNWPLSAVRLTHHTCDRAL
jgi:hypothetical protein